MSGYAPAAGAEIAGYRIDALAGRGGMGEVYRAWDERLGRYVALKLVAPRLADDERFRERFLRESRLAAGIDHPNVIPVYEAGEADGRLYIAMRYVEGSDLRKLLTYEGVFDPERALRLLAPIAGALDAAHARGLVHRDVKPGNVLIAVDPNADPPEHVYLSDFGLTTLSADPGDGGPFSGTAEYAAPELVTGGPVDGRADVYALGCILFECLTGTPPYRGDSVLTTLWGHVNDPVPAATARNPDLPPAIDGVLRKALAKEPRDRFPSGRALIEAARDPLGISGIEVPAIQRRRWFAAVAALVLGLAVAGVALGIVLTRGGEGTAAPASGGAAVRIDPATNSASAAIAVGDGASAVGAAPDGVWVASYHEGTLWRIDPQSLIAARVPSIGAPSGIALHGGRVYVAAEGPSAASGNVTDYDAATGSRRGSVELLACSVAAGAEGIWAAGCPNVQRLSADDKPKIVANIPISFRHPRTAANDRNELSSMAAGLGFLWVLGDAADRRVWRVDPKRNAVAGAFSLDFSPADIAAGAGAVWVVDQINDRLVRLDASSGGVTARIAVGRGARAVAVGAGSVWVACFLDRTVVRVDPITNRVVSRIKVAESPRDVAVGAGGVWAVGDAA